MYQQKARKRKSKKREMEIKQKERERGQVASNSNNGHRDSFFSLSLPVCFAASSILKFNFSSSETGRFLLIERKKQKKNLFFGLTPKQKLCKSQVEVFFFFSASFIPTCFRDSTCQIKFF